VYRDTQLAQKPTVTGKNRAIPVLHRDSFTGLTGQVQGRLLRQVTFTELYCRAVRHNSYRFDNQFNPFNNDSSDLPSSWDNMTKNMKNITFLVLIVIAISCNNNRVVKNTNSQIDSRPSNILIRKPDKDSIKIISQKDSISSNILFRKLDKDSIEILSQTESKIDTMTVRRKVFLDYKRYSKYKDDLYKISKQPLGTYWSKDIYRPKRSLDSTLKINPFAKLKKAYISISKLGGSYILFSQGADDLAFRLEFIGDTTMTGLGLMGWYVNYYKSFDYKNNKYTICYRSEYSDSNTLEIKIIDKLNDIQIWKTTITDPDKTTRVFYDLNVPIDFALTLPILVIDNSIGLDPIYEGIDHVDLEKMFNE
jgi:hypothetical protein